MANVVWSVGTTNRKDPLDPANFMLKAVPVTQVTNDSVRTLEELEGMYAKEVVLPDEALKKNRIATKGDIHGFSLDEGYIEYGLSFERLEDAVGGKLRKDDIIDIIQTTTTTGSDPIIETKSLIENVKIVDARSSGGISIDREDTATPANIILLGLSPEDALIVENVKSTSKLKLVRKDDASKTGVYENKKVQNGLVK